MHAAGLVEVPAFALQLLHVAAGAQQGDEVAAGRGSPDADVVRVEVVLLRLGPQPADRRLAVLDLGGEHRMLAQPVVDAGHRVALADERHGGAAILAAGLPGPAMNPDDQGQLALGLLRQVKVEPMPLVTVLDVREIPQDLDAFRESGRRRPLLRDARFPQPSTTANPANQTRLSFMSHLLGRVPGQHHVVVSAPASG